MKNYFTILFLVTILTIHSQIESNEFGRQICDKYITNKVSLTPNKLKDEKKNGLWTFYYDINDTLIETSENAEYFFIINMEDDKPKDMGCFCSLKGNFESYVTYLDDTTWTPDKEYLYFYKNGQFNDIYIYEKGKLIKHKAYLKKGTIEYSESFEYINSDTLNSIIIYRKNGSIIIEEQQLNGKEHGNYKIYYPSGKLRLEAISTHGLRTNQITYFKNGKIKRESTCSTIDKPCVDIIYNKKGEKIMEGFSKPGTRTKLIR